MELNKQNVKNLIVLAIIVILIYQVLDNINYIFRIVSNLLNMLFPFIMGLAIAFVLNVPLRFIEKKLEKICKKKSFVYKKKRIISFLLTILLVLGLICLVAFLVVPQLTITITQIIDQIPKFSREVTKLIRSLQEEIPQLKNTLGSLEQVWDFIGKALSKLTTDQITGMFTSTVGIISGVVSSITTFFISMVFACYVLFQKETLSEQCKKLFYAILPIKMADRIIGMARVADRTFSNFLVGQCTEAIILGTLFVIVMAIFGMPYNVMIGVMIGVLSLIPIVGAFIGCFVGAFLILMVNPMQALGFIALFLILQQIEGNLIYPHVVGNSVGLPSIWVLGAVTVGGSLMGVAGMLLGIPVVSMLYTILARYVNVKLMTKKVAEYKWKNKEEREDNKPDKNKGTKEK